MHTIIINCPSQASQRSLRGMLGDAARFAFGWIIDWQARASERAHLHELSDHLLKDVGLTREQVLYGINTRQHTRC
jgi:uncharacterized protein YjiS (DUF1127 family)